MQLWRNTTEINLFSMKIKLSTDNIIRQYEEAIAIAAAAAVSDIGNTIFKGTKHSFPCLLYLAPA